MLSHDLSSPQIIIISILDAMGHGGHGTQKNSEHQKIDASSTTLW